MQELDRQVPLMDEIDSKVKFFCFWVGVLLYMQQLFLESAFVFLCY